MNSELKAVLERLGPIRVVSHDRSFSDELVGVVLRRDAGPFVTAVAVARRLFASGLSMRAAHAAINRLAAEGCTVCEVPADGGIEELARDLDTLNVHLHRRRTFPEPATFVATVRARHHLSQREFAGALGLDVRTLQNWEQGRNTPDSAALLLIAMFDRDPAAVPDVLYGPATERASVPA